MMMTEMMMTEMMMTEMMRCAGDDAEEGETEDGVEGMGMGEGEGKKNVSDQVRARDQRQKCTSALQAVPELRGLSIDFAARRAWAGGA
eukprot:3879860-Rhodomonas_salina.1